MTCQKLAIALDRRPPQHAASRRRLQQPASLTDWGRAGWLAVVLVASALLATAAGAQSIHRCIAPDGRVTFTDIACEGAATSAPTRAAANPSPPLGLSPAEKQALAQLTPKLRRALAAREQARRQHARDFRQARARRTQLCRAARARLSDLQRLKRQGYSAKRAKQLDARYRKARAQQRANC